MGPSASSLFDRDDVVGPVPLLSSEWALLSQKCMGDVLALSKPYLEMSKLDEAMTISSSTPSESLDISKESMSRDLKFVFSI